MSAFAVGDRVTLQGFVARRHKGKACVVVGYIQAQNRYSLHCFDQHGRWQAGRLLVNARFLVASPITRSALALGHRSWRAPDANSSVDGSAGSARLSAQDVAASAHERAASDTQRGRRRARLTPSSQRAHRRARLTPSAQAGVPSAAVSPRSTHASQHPAAPAPQAPGFTLIGHNKRCCDGTAYNSTGLPLRDGDGAMETHLANRSLCEAACARRSACSFYSFAEQVQVRRGSSRWSSKFKPLQAPVCVLCRGCQLSVDHRYRRKFFSWARRIPPSATRVRASSWLARVLAPLALNGSYSERLYGRRGLMPPVEELRVLWMALLPNASVRALARRAAPCRFQGAPPFRPLYSVRDTAFATPLDSLWLHAGFGTARPVRSHEYVEVTHCPDRRTWARPVPAFKFVPQWLYAAAGSGVSVNVGRTLVLSSYADAAMLLELLFQGDAQSYAPDAHTDGCEAGHATNPVSAALPPRDVAPHGQGTAPRMMPTLSTPPAYRYTAHHAARRLNASEHERYREHDEAYGASAAHVWRAGYAAHNKWAARLEDLRALDSIQILSNQEWFSPYEKRHEVVLLRQRDCSPLTAPAAQERARHPVRCGRAPHVTDCDASAVGSAALARLETCTDQQGVLSARTRALLAETEEERRRANPPGRQGTSWSCEEVAAGCWSAAAKPEVHHCSRDLARQYEEAVPV